MCGVGEGGRRRGGEWVDGSEGVDSGWEGVERGGEVEVDKGCRVCRADGRGG